MSKRTDYRHRTVQLHTKVQLNRWDMVQWWELGKPQAYFGNGTAKHPYTGKGSAASRLETSKFMVQARQIPRYLSYLFVLHPQAVVQRKLKVYLIFRWAG